MTDVHGGMSAAAAFRVHFKTAASRARDVDTAAARMLKRVSAKAAANKAASAAVSSLSDRGVIPAAVVFPSSTEMLGVLLDFIHSGLRLDSGKIIAACQNQHVRVLADMPDAISRHIREVRTNNDGIITGIKLTGGLEAARIVADLSPSFISARAHEQGRVGIPLIHATPLAEQPPETAETTGGGGADSSSGA